MANTVEIVVKGTDQSGARAINSAAASTKQLKEHASGASAGLKLMGAAAGAFVGTKLVGFLHDSVNEARDAQRANAQTAAVIKSTGGAAHVTAGQIGDLAGAISKKVGIDDQEIQAGENMLLTFTNVRNEVGKGNDIFNQATQTVTDMSVALGQDMKTSAIQLGKALNDPIKGVTALQRVGVTFSEEQKKQIKTLMQHNNILGAQKIILGELNKEFGGSAAAQATAGDKMAATWKQFEQSIGSKLIPVLDTTLNALMSIGDWIGAHATLVSTLAAGFGALFLAFKSYKVVHDFNIAMQALNLTMRANVILTIVAGLIALGTWFVITYKKSQEFRDNVGDAFSDVKIWALETGQWVINYLYIPMLTAFSGIIHAAAATFGWLPFGIGQKLHDAAAKMDEFRRKADADLHGIKADINTEQAKMKTRDLQRQIDNIRQGKVPGIKAGTEQAMAAIASLKWQIATLQGKRIDIYAVTTQVQRTVFQTFNGSMPLNATGGVFRGYATGGAYGAAGSINERGPELVRLPTGSMVYPTGQSKRMWQEANRSKEPAPVVLEIHSGGTRLDDLLVEILRKAVRVRGGNVQTVIGR